MSDEADMSDKRIEDVVTESLFHAARAVSLMPVGEPGECDFCGEYYSRLVVGACGFCRDKYRL